MKLTTVRSTQDRAYRVLGGYEPLDWEGEALLSDDTLETYGLEELARPFCFGSGIISAL
jgi:hypothetical protein